MTIGILVHRWDLATGKDTIRVHGLEGRVRSSFFAELWQGHPLHRLLRGGDGSLKIASQSVFLNR